MNTIRISRLAQLAPFCLILALMLSIPFAAQSGTIDVNGTCEVGCPTTPSLSSGMSTSGVFNFTYTFGDGDMYDVSGNYGASYSSTTGSTIVVNPTVVYAGSSPSVAADTVTFDYLQGYYDAGPGSWAGTYTETIPLTFNATGGTISAQLFYDGEGIGLAGPYGPGTYYYTKSTALDFGASDTSDTLSADYNFTYNFAAGTTTGQGGGSVPEPVTTIPCCLCLVVSLLYLRRRNRGMMYNQSLDNPGTREGNV